MVTFMLSLILLMGGIQLHFFWAISFVKSQGQGDTASREDWDER